MPDNPEIVVALDLIKDAIASIAKEVYHAQADGKITWMEAITLVGTSAVYATAIVGAFKTLSKESTEELIEALANSDLVLK